MALGRRQGPGARKVRRAAERGGVETAARVGYAARAVVYGVVGVLALLLALGRGGRTTGGEGAVQEVAQQPLAPLLLALLGTGLMGFAAWRFVQALRDLEGRGRSPQGLALRAGLAGSGLLHAGLGFYAFRLLAGRGGGGGDQTRELTAQVMSRPLGTFLVGAAGVGVLVFALQQLHRAWRGQGMERLALQGLAAQQRTQVERLFRAGVAARAVVFLVMGVFLVRAALQSDPGEARGLGPALSTLAAQPFGSVLLGLVAAGLVAYAVLELLAARYRRIPTV